MVSSTLKKDKKGRKTFNLVSEDDPTQPLAVYKSRTPKAAAMKALTKLSRDKTHRHNQKTTIWISQDGAETMRRYVGHTTAIENQTEFQKQHNIEKERVCKFVETRKFINPRVDRLYAIVDKEFVLRVKCSKFSRNKNNVFTTTSACRKGLSVSKNVQLEQTEDNVFTVLDKRNKKTENTVKGTLLHRAAAAALRGKPKRNPRGAQSASSATKSAGEKPGKTAAKASAKANKKRKKAQPKKKTKTYSGEQTASEDVALSSTTGGDSATLDVTCASGTPVENAATNQTLVSVN